MNTENRKAAFRIFSPKGEAVFQDISVGFPDRVDLKLPIPASLSGTITNINGTPAKGIWVTLDSHYKMYSDHKQSNVESGISGIYGTTTNQQGRYTIPEMSPEMPYFITLRETTEKGGHTLSPRIPLAPHAPANQKFGTTPSKKASKLPALYAVNPAANHSKAFTSPYEMKPS